MTHKHKITNENAESIGRPIFDKIIQSFVSADYQELIRRFPELQNKMTKDLFDEAVGNIRPLGNVLSIQYSTHNLKNDSHLIVWNVRYSQDKEGVLWTLHLADDQEEIKVTGFGFNR